MARISLYPLVVALSLIVGAPETEAARAQTPPAKGVCFSTSETREEIKSHHLVEPFVALKSASVSVKAEALSAKLCRVGDEFVYEIALLHRDGRLVHVVMSAVTGKLTNTRVSQPLPRT
jgi:hypothetical protein